MMRRLVGGFLGARLVVVAVAAAVVSAALWAPLAEPMRVLRANLPAGALLGSLALAAVLLVLRAPLQGLTGWLSRHVPLGFVVPPLLATVLFALSWAGAHADRGEEIGLVPQLVFPATAGIFAFAVARWGGGFQRAAGPWFRGRDHVGRRTRVVLLIVLTTGAAYALPRSLGVTDRATSEQLLVVFGMAVGYLLVAPHIRVAPPSAPGGGAVAGAAVAILFAAGLMAMTGGTAAAATPTCPAKVGIYNLFKGQDGSPPKVQATTGAAGGFTLGCFYTDGSGNFNPVVGLGDLTGPAVQAFWRERAGTDQYTSLECRGGTFAVSGFGLGATAIGSPNRRAFVVSRLDPKDVPSFAPVASALLAAIEPNGIPCAAAASATATPRATTTTRGLPGAIDMTFAGAVNGHITELAAVPQCGPDTTFGTGFYGFGLKGKLGNDVYTILIAGPKGTSTPKKFVANANQVSIGGPVMTVDAPGASTTGAPVVGKEWASSTSGVGTITIVDENSGSVDVTLGPPANAPAGTPALRVTGTWRCGGLGVVPIVPPPGGGTGGVVDLGGGTGDFDTLVDSLVTLGMDPGTARTFAEAVNDLGIPVTQSLLGILTVLIATGGVPSMFAGVAAGTGTMPIAGTRVPTAAIVDPYTGKPLTVWAPGTYGPGADGRNGSPGEVWFQGNWVKPDDAVDQINRSVAADTQRQRDLDDGAFGRQVAATTASWPADGPATAPGEDPATRARRAAELQHELELNRANLALDRADTADFQGAANRFGAIVNTADHLVAFLKGWVPGGNYYGYAYDVLKHVGAGATTGDWENEMRAAAIDVGKDAAGNVAQDLTNLALLEKWSFRTDLPADLSRQPISEVVKHVWRELPTRPEGESLAKWGEYGRRLGDTDAVRHSIQWGENELSNLAGRHGAGDDTMRGVVDGFDKAGGAATSALSETLRKTLSGDGLIVPGGSPYGV